MIDCPAFVLGNGSTLPVDALPLLRGRLSIGVNRILRSGFVPTVLTWIDVSVWQEEWQPITECGALLVTNRNGNVPAGGIGLDLVPGAACWTGLEQTSRQLKANGNTAVMAARWALSLGCSRVYLAGCAARGAGDFYGANRHHGGNTLYVMRRELGLFLSHFGDRSELIETADDLCRAAADAGDVDEAAVKAAIRKACQ